MKGEGRKRASGKRGIDPPRDEMVAVAKLGDDTQREVKIFAFDSMLQLPSRNRDGFEPMA